MRPAAAVVSQRRKERNSFSMDLLGFEDIDERDMSGLVLISICAGHARLFGDFGEEIYCWDI